MTKLDWFQEYNVDSSFLKCLWAGLSYSFKGVKEKKYRTISKDAEKYLIKCIFISDKYSQQTRTRREPPYL